MGELLSGFYGFLTSLFGIFPVFIQRFTLATVGVFVIIGLLKYFKRG